MRKNIRIYLVALTCALALVLVFTALGSSGGTPNALAKESLLDIEASQTEPLQPVVLQSTQNDTSPPLADLVALEKPNPNVGDYEVPLRSYEMSSDTSFDPNAVQNQLFGGYQMPLPTHSFEGIFNVVDWPSVGIPPDTNGDVGYDSISGSKF